MNECIGGGAVYQRSGLPVNYMLFIYFFSVHVISQACLGTQFKNNEFFECSIHFKNMFTWKAYCAIFFLICGLWRSQTMATDIMKFYMHKRMYYLHGLKCRTCRSEYCFSWGTWFQWLIVTCSVQRLINLLFRSTICSLGSFLRKLWKSNFIISLEPTIAN